MNLIWRFYTDELHRWKWQQLSVAREVITESLAAYGEYEVCVADAQSKGYVFHPSRVRLAPKGAYAETAAAARRGKLPA
jgi:hypothetical protein